MKNFDESVKMNYSLNWLYISDHPYRILIIGNSGSGKTNILFNLINQQPDINKREKAGTQHLKNLGVFIDYSQTIDDVYENSEDYNLTKKRQVLENFNEGFNN